MIPLARNIKRYVSLKEFVVVFLALALSITAGVTVFKSLKKEVAINDNGMQIALKTMKSTVKDVLEQNGIKVSEYDYISVPLDSKLQRISLNVINIKRAVPVKVLVDGQEKQIMTYKDKVSEVIAQGNITLGKDDFLDGAQLDNGVVEGMTVRIVRVTEEVVKETYAIPFNVVSRENNRMDAGVEQTVREGKEGTEEKDFKLVKYDGKEISKEQVSDIVVTDPIDKLVEYGTLLTYKPTRGDPFRYTKVLDMSSTAYTSSYADTGKNPGDPNFGITSTGMRAVKGVVAVDPRVIPLGTRLYIEVAGNTPDYGYAVAADTGSGVKNSIIDLYFDDGSYARSWGIKRVKVYILAD